MFRHQQRQAEVGARVEQMQAEDERRRQVEVRKKAIGYGKMKPLDRPEDYVIVKPFGQRKDGSKYDTKAVAVRKDVLAKEEEAIKQLRPSLPGYITRNAAVRSLVDKGLVVPLTKETPVPLAVPETMIGRRKTVSFAEQVREANRITPEQWKAIGKEVGVGAGDAFVPFFHLTAIIHKFYQSLVGARGGL